MTKKKILTAAATVFNTYGYEGSQVATICDQGKATKGSVYFHFPSKESIAQELIVGWDTFVERTSHGVTTNTDVLAFFKTLEHAVTNDVQLRAGMKLSTEPTVDTGGSYERFWGTVERLTGDSRLATLLCSGFVGIFHVAACNPSLGMTDDIVSDMVSAHLHL